MFRCVSDRFPAGARMVARNWWSFIHWHRSGGSDSNCVRAHISQNHQPPSEIRGWHCGTGGHGQHRWIWCHSPNGWTVMVFMDLYSQRSLDCSYPGWRSLRSWECMCLHLCLQLSRPFLWHLRCVRTRGEYAFTKYCRSLSSACRSVHVRQSWTELGEYASGSFGSRVHLNSGGFLFLRA